MPKIHPRLQALVGATSDGGSSVTKDELAGAASQVPAAELTAFAKRAVDTLASSDALDFLSQKVGPQAMPAPLQSFQDQPAGRAFLDGSLTVVRGDAASRDATILIQRALMKVGALHVEGKNHPELLLMPWGADGALGAATVAALNSALVMAGREDLTPLTVDSPLGQDVAAALEKLLGQTPRVVHPALVTPPPAGPSSLWGKRPLTVTTLPTDTKWTSVLTRMDAERPSYAHPETLDAASRYWLGQLDEARTLAPRAQLNRVNSLVNDWNYVSDTENYGVSDYWASPAEFMARRGDCEDYCMVKYQSLLQLGFHEEQLRLLVVLDKESNTGHALLAVDMPDGTYILDNQNRFALKAQDVVQLDSSDPRYLPVSAMSRSGRWRFV